MKRRQVVTRQEVLRWVYRLVGQVVLAMLILVAGTALMVAGQLTTSLYVLIAAGLIGLATLLELFVLMFRVASGEYGR